MKYIGPSHGSSKKTKQLSCEILLNVARELFSKAVSKGRETNAES